ncbi:MAG TPA: OsmC family protein [Bordetella sp.]
MAETKTETQPETKQVQAQTIGLSGRYLIDAEGNIFVSDSASGREEGTVAPEPTHFLLSALAVCALGSVEKEARERGVTVAGGTAQVTSVRDEHDRTRFANIQIDVTVRGVTQAQAELLVAHFTGNCPIYNTLRRGGPIAVSVRAEA